MQASPKVLGFTSGVPLGIFSIAAKATASQSFAPRAIRGVLRIKSINLNIMCWPGPHLPQLWNMTLPNMAPAGVAQDEAVSAMFQWSDLCELTSDISTCESSLKGKC